MPREVINYNDYDQGSSSVDPTAVRQFGIHQGKVAHAGAHALSSKPHRTLQAGSGISKVRSLMSRAKKNIKNMTMTRPKLKIHPGSFDQV